MAVSPVRSSLYRSFAALVILSVAAVALTHAGFAQSAKSKVKKTPRAIALLEIPKNGKARLFPIAILDDGKFFDAGAYKAQPVPMALEPQTVYEGVLGGVSQGLFTITGAGQMNDAWFAEGTWLPTGAEAPRKGKKAEMPVIKDDRDAPPTLKRPGTEPKPADKKPEKPDEKTQPPVVMKPVIPPPPDEPKPAPEPSAGQDSSRPTLRRGLPSPKPETELPAAQPASQPTSLRPKPADKNAPQTFVGISDAAGPEFRPYNFGAKPDEIEKYLKLMLDLAAQDVRKRIEAVSAASQPVDAKRAAKKSPASAAAKGPRPQFSDIDFRVFDLSNANEPVWILTAKAQLPASSSAPDAPATAEYFVTLVCRTDIYGDLRKLLSQITDARHLDVVSRLQLIDAVDADGDGRGELLFREISAGNSPGYLLYRFTGDTLWKLFDSFGGD
jgi:hypothetical protein